MQPTLTSSDRIGVWKLSGQVQRGDLVVVDGYGSFTLNPEQDFVTRIVGLLGFENLGNRYFVKRVIGVGGDAVQCCTPARELVLNGKVLDEPYLLGNASDVDFDVVVPAGHVWLMGDNRANSRDSRDLLGLPGGGMIPENRIVGRVSGIVWPPARMRTLAP